MKLLKLSVDGYYGTRGESSHDYDPEWDYQLDTRPSKKFMKIFENAANDITSKHMALFQECFTAFRIVFCKWQDEALARFISGTCSEPVIVVSLSDCVKIQKELKDDFTLYQVAKST